MLQGNLSSHKAKLCDLEKVHQARMKELAEARDELQKFQEESQAKISQVKQYKKQHDGLVSKVKHDCHYLVYASYVFVECVNLSVL